MLAYGAASYTLFPGYAAAALPCGSSPSTTGCPLAHDVDAAREIVRPLVGQHCGASYRVGEHHLSDVVFDALLGGPGAEAARSPCTVVSPQSRIASLSRPSAMGLPSVDGNT